MSLIDRLPTTRGRQSSRVPLGKVTWFRTGGEAEVLFRPEDAEDLATFFKGKPKDVPVTVIGVGSNLLVRDGGVPGVVVRLTGGFAQIDAHGDEIEAGAGALDMSIAMTALNEGLAGLEFLSGIPGGLGGALRMNAGAYDREIKDVLIWAEAVSPQGEIKRFGLEDMGFSYRHCGVPEGWVFTKARLKGHKGDPKDIAERMTEVKRNREESQPTRARTGGSTFANPDGQKAWELIDKAGCRGLTIGKAQVSEKHCNFLINQGGATAKDLEALGEEVRRRVKETSGVELRWEIRRVGIPLENGDAA